MKLREWNAHLHGLVVFRALLNDPVVAKLLDLTDRMEAGSTSYGPVCDAVAAFEAALFEYTTNWGSYLSNAVLEAETICVRQAAAGQLDAPQLGELFYFLELCCGVSAYILDVNPFNQPGVEAYKKNMFALLDKPGYEAESKAIQERLSQEA